MHRYSERPISDQPISGETLRRLTPAQLEVLDLICLGLTNAQIGDRLGKSPGTVKRHVAEILRRLQARTRAEAAVIHVQARTIDILSGRRPPERVGEDGPNGTLTPVR